MEKSQLQTELQPLRESTVLLVLRVVFLMILADTIYLLIRLLALDLRSNWFPRRDITLFFLLFLSSLYLIQAFIVAVIIAVWSHRYYLITGDKITEVGGVVSRKERIYELKNAKSVKLSRGILGRIFNYGTVFVAITSPNMSEEVILTNIPEAEAVEDYIKQFL